MFIVHLKLLTVVLNKGEPNLKKKRPGDSSRIDKKIDSNSTKSNTVIIMAEQIS